jgi:putative aldouronate transport system substrate-binding protein
MHYGTGIIFNDNWEVFKKAAELTNVTLKGTASASASNSQEVFNIMIASGKLPDIIHSGDYRDFLKYGKQGAFKPLENYMKYAPHYKAFLDANPDIRKFVTAPDGHMYFIPAIADGYASLGWFIRQDWLDKLKLKMPKTVQEYHDVLKAFVNDDPNGNGKKDEIGFMNRSTASNVNDLLPLWDAHAGFYVDAKGKVKFGPLEPEYKDAMTNIAAWYKEGLIDREIFTRGNNARNILLDNNTLGSTHDWFGSTAKYNYTYNNKVPGLKLVVMTPPASKKGLVFEETKREKLKQPNPAWGMSYSNKYPIETMKYFDFWFTKEGRILENFGIEGKTYNMVNGQPKFTDDFIAKKTLSDLNQMGAQLQFGFQQDFNYEKQLLLTDISNVGIEMYTKNNYFRPQYPILSFSDNDQKIINNKMTAINTLILETSQKWVLGGEAVQTGYDEFVKTLKKLGIDDVIKANVNAYYKYSTKN